MECLHPLSIKNPRYGKIKRGTFGQGFKHRGIPEPQYIEVPCGKCVACLSKRRQEWVFRLQQEQKHSLTSWFVTLTYEDSQLPTLKQAKEYNNSLPPDKRKTENHEIMEIYQKSHVQKFLKRLRKYYTPFVPDPYSIRYFVVSDYGGNFHRLHYHMLLFNFPLRAADCSRIEISHRIQKYWKHGGVNVGEVNDKSINYTCKYCLQRPDVTGAPKTWMTCSNKPGIGAAYLTEHTHNNVIRLGKPVVRVGDSMYRKLPRYYVYKILPYDVPFADKIRYNYSEVCKLQLQRKYDDTLNRYLSKYGSESMAAMAYTNDLILRHKEYEKRVIQSLIKHH